MEQDAAPLSTDRPVAAAAQPGPPPDGGSLRRLLRVLGPGFITGASDDDPSGIGTYASVGAAFGYALLWMAPVALPMMVAVQYTCAKIGLVAGAGIAGVLRRHYPRGLLYPTVIALIVANAINAGADIGAIAAGIGLLIPVRPALLIAPIGLAILALQLWGSYRLIARIFRWLALALVAYVAAAFFARPDWPAAARGALLPAIRLDPPLLMAMVAMLGTTISPYLFFWQASEEVEEEIGEGRGSEEARRGATPAELRAARLDVAVGMVFSQLVTFFIILTTAATLHAGGVTEVATAEAAARALEPLAGRWAEALFALGLIGAGALAVPVLTTAGAYAAAEAWGWPGGLNQKLRAAKGFYAVIVGATLFGVAIPALGIDPIRALYWTAVLNGLLAPPLLALIVAIASNPAVMGERVNGRGLNALCWATTLAMGAAALALVVSWL